MAEGKGATATTTVSGSSSNNGNGPLLIVGLLLFGAAPMFFLIGLVLGPLSSTGPNPRGATLAQGIDPSPSSEVRELLTYFESTADVGGFLRNNGELLTEYQSKLTLLGDKLRQDDPAYASVRDKQAALSQIIVILGRIETIRSQIASGGTAAATPQAKELIKDIARLRELFAISHVEAAREIVEQNAASGYRLFPYESTTEARLGIFRNITSGTNDCSSFVAFSLYKAGYKKFSAAPGNADIYRFVKKGDSGLEIMAESSDTGGLSPDEVRAVLQPGDIIISSHQADGLRVLRGGDRAENAHAAIYAGGNVVYHSTGGREKDGPQESTLDSRLDPNLRYTHLIIRPMGVEI
jgi:hypothetical protein